MSEHGECGCGTVYAHLAETGTSFTTRNDLTGIARQPLAPDEESNVCGFAAAGFLSKRRPLSYLHTRFGHHAAY